MIKVPLSALPAAYEINSLHKHLIDSIGHSDFSYLINGLDYTFSDGKLILSPIKVKSVDPKDDFCNIGCKTHFSFMNGYGHLKVWYEQLQKFGQSAIAITDNVTSGFVDIHKLTKNPIYGHDFRLHNHHRYSSISFLAMSDIGFRNLCAISSQSAIESKDEILLENAIKHNQTEGLFVLLSGPFSYLFPNFLFQFHEDSGVDVLIDRFGQENVGIGIVNYTLTDNKSTQFNVISSYNAVALEMADKYGIIPYATSNPLFPSKNDLKVFPLWANMKRFAWNYRQSLTTRDEWIRSFSLNYPELQDQAEKLCDNTLVIRDKCAGKVREFCKEKYFPVWNFKDEVSDFRSLVFDKLNEYLIQIDKDNHKVYVDRIEEELKLINSKQFDDYFLIVYDIYQFAKREGIPTGPGRGSVSGSLVAYVLGFTKVDPLIYGTYFSRFLNEARSDYPDIDMDFASEIEGGRDAVREYVFQRYGKDKVVRVGVRKEFKLGALIGEAFRYFGGKSTYDQRVIVTRVLDTTFRRLKGYKASDAFTVGDFEEFIALDSKQNKPIVNGILANFVHTYPESIDFIKGALFQNQQFATHAGGVVILPKPITETMIPVTVYEGTDERITITAFDKDDLEVAGAVKFDLLAVSELDFVHYVCNRVKENDSSFDISKIDYDDSSIYEIFKRQLTLGIFQFNTSGCTKFLQKYRPRNLQQLVFASAVYRPGPLEGGFHTFGALVNNGFLSIEDSDLPKAILPFTQKTHGTFIYQEQIMEIAHHVGGLNLSESDNFRRAIKKADKELITKHKKKFVENYSELTTEQADRLFEIFIGFSKYAFNYSHALTYSMLSAWTCHLKRYYTREFFEVFFDTKEVNLCCVALNREFSEFGFSYVMPDISNKCLSKAKFDDNTIGIPFHWITGLNNVTISMLELLKSRIGSYKDLVYWIQAVNSSKKKKKENSGELFSDEISIPSGFSFSQVILNILSRTGCFNSLMDLPPIDYVHWKQSDLNNFNKKLDQLSKDLDVSIKSFVDLNDFHESERKYYKSYVFSAKNKIEIDIYRKHVRINKYLDKLKNKDETWSFGHELFDGKRIKTIIYVENIYRKKSENHWVIKGSNLHFNEVLIYSGDNDLSYDWKGKLLIVDFEFNRAQKQFIIHHVSIKNELVS